MRILIVSEVFWPEDFVINDLANEWQQMGNHVEVVTQYPSYPHGRVYDGYKNQGETDENWNGIIVHRFPLIEGYRDSKIKKFANYIKFVRQGRKIVKRIAKRFDVIFVSQTGPLTVALPAIYAKQLSNASIVIWTEDIWPDVVWTYGVPKLKPIVWYLDKLIKKVYNNCDRIFVSSKSFEDIIKRYTNQKIEYAPNWLRPTNESVSDIHLDKTKFNFMFTGNVSRYQNLINTVLGFGRAKLQNCILNIVGDGSYLDQVKQIVDENKIENVVFHGRKPYSTMNDILRQSDVLLLPLIADEGICKTEPFKIQSYLNSGKPIMGILIGSGKEIIEENGIGLVAEPDDIDDISRVFIEMIDFAKQSGDSVSVKAKSLMNTRFCREKIISFISSNLKK